MREIPWVKIAVATFVASLVVGFVVIVRGGSQLPDEIQPIEWNRQACAHCGMLVGEPAYAAELITDDGEVAAFDDPGCALRYLDERAPRIHRMWFHHHTEDKWIPIGRARFITGQKTPMGSGLGAVEDGGPNALDLVAATRLAKEQR